MEKALGAFQLNSATVDHMNSKAKGVTFGLNGFYDMPSQDYDALNTLIVEETELDDHRDLPDNHDGGRRLAGDRSLDWAKADKMTPVKNQGGCGSCWAFAATSVQEAMQGLKDNQKPPLRLSEQEGVDCVYTDRDGCRGGWM